VKSLFLLIFIFSPSAFAMSSTADIGVYGVVPLQLQVTLLETTAQNYLVHEVSNSREGYQVRIETDSPEVNYNGRSIHVVDGEAVITQVAAQDRSIDIYKPLILNPGASYARALIEAVQ
jgi:hypothetical protein